MEYISIGIGQILFDIKVKNNNLKQHYYFYFKNKNRRSDQSLEEVTLSNFFLCLNQINRLQIIFYMSELIEIK